MIITILIIILVILAIIEVFGAYNVLGFPIIKYNLILDEYEKLDEDMIYVIQGNIRYISKVALFITCKYYISINNTTFKPVLRWSKLHYQIKELYKNTN